MSSTEVLVASGIPQNVRLKEHATKGQLLDKLPDLDMTIRTSVPVDLKLLSLRASEAISFDSDIGPSNYSHDE